MKTKRYISPEKVLESYWGVKMGVLEGGVSDTEDLETGEKGIITTEQQLESIRKQKVWGFIDNEQTIHFWADKKVRDEKLIYFLGHEIGHVFGKQYKTLSIEEKKAEEFAKVALEAHKTLNSINSKEEK